MRRMFSFDEVVSAVNGTVVNRKGSISGNLFISGVSTDTRTIKEGDIYIALKGENFDGHNYTSDAILKGAYAVVVNSATKVPDNAVGIVVKDTCTALGDLARHYRFKLGAKVIAVTGSVGKTTTRNLITAALEPSFNVYSTKKNLNNEIGLPTTILQAPDNTNVLVLEMGMRGRGEIEYLTKIANPDIAVITNVGYSHIGRLGSREEIRAAKCEIIDGLTEQGILIVNGDDGFLSDYVRNIIPLNNGLAEVCSDKAVTGPVGIRAYDIKDNDGTDFNAVITVGDRKNVYENMHISLSGSHNVRNACFALFIADFLKADMDLTRKAIASYTPMDGRGKTYYGKKYTIINDAYNASPESMAASFPSLQNVKGKRKIAVLGGMLELGDQSPLLHEKTGEAAGRFAFDKVIVTGEDRDAFIRGFRKNNKTTEIISCEDTQEVSRRLSEIIREGDAVLFKASHSFGFETLAEGLIDDDKD